MSKIRVLWIPIVLVAALATTSVSAETLLVQRVERAKASALPLSLIHISEPTRPY